jgi:hypothetical protein
VHCTSFQGRPLLVRLMPPGCVASLLESPPRCTPYQAGVSYGWAPLSSFAIGIQELAVGSLQLGWPCGQYAPSCILAWVLWPDGHGFTLISVVLNACPACSVDSENSERRGGKCADACHASR